MAKIYDNIEIGLTKDELRQALRKWVDAKTSLFDYRVTDVTISPGAKYVVRFTVEPPLDAAARKAVTQKPEPLQTQETV